MKNNKIRDALIKALKREQRNYENIEKKISSVMKKYQDLPK
jgi:hypothetical protein